VALWVIFAGLASWSWFGGSQSAEQSGRPLLAYSSPTDDHDLKPIQDIRPGDRVLGENPLRDDVETDVYEPEPIGWRCFESLGTGILRGLG